MDMATIQTEHYRLVAERQGLVARIKDIGDQISGLRRQQEQLMADYNATSGAIQILDKLMGMEKGQPGEAETPPLPEVVTLK